MISRLVTHAVDRVVTNTARWLNLLGRPLSGPFLHRRSESPWRGGTRGQADLVLRQCLADLWKV